MINWYNCWFFTRTFIGDFNFKGFTARRLYKSFDVKWLRWAEKVIPKLPKKIIPHNVVTQKTMIGIAPTVIGRKFSS
jgi:hypothetical protein